jgi:dimethylargininase
MLRVLALTREVSSAIGRCQLTHLARHPIDVALARTQHRQYELALERLGCDVRRLPGGDEMPDSVFIEDSAVVLPELAIVTRPGAESRRAETGAVADALRPLRRLIHIEAPGTVDGGDVLVVGRTLFVGRSSRTNDPGIEQLRSAATPYRYTVKPMTPTGCLHLKSAVTALGGDAVLLNPRWLSIDEFAGHDCQEVDPSEPGAANVVAVGGRLLAAAAYPFTCDRLERRGFDVLRVDVSEIAKAEGALTCCSLLVA